MPYSLAVHSAPLPATRINAGEFQKPANKDRGGPSLNSGEGSAAAEGKPVDDVGPQTVIYGRDVIVIGSSAGGLEPLRCLLGDLPANLKAAIFVVTHLGSVSYLAEI